MGDVGPNMEINDVMLINVVPLLVGVVENKEVHPMIGVIDFMGLMVNMMEIKRYKCQHQH
jgi:hypothetical protein